MSATEPSEIPADLAANAKAVFKMAPRYCPAETHCLLYHRLWPLARIARGAPFQLAGSDFFLQHIRRRAGPGASRLLIAGAADTGLLNLVHEGIVANENAVTVVLADRCPTVIEQNKLLASRLGIQLECHQADLLHLECAPVDIIVAHSVFTFVPADKRTKLFSRWENLLNQDGEVILSSLMHQSMPAQSFVPPSSLSREQFLLAAQAIGFSESEQQELHTILADGWQFKNLLHRAPVIDDFLSCCTSTGLQVSEMQQYPFVHKERGPAISGDYASSKRIEACLVKCGT